MKSKLAQACVLVGVGLVCGVVIAQQARPDKKAIAAELQKISAPAAEHRNFDPFLGSFDEEIEYEGGGGQPVLIEGDASGQWVLGNRFLELNAHADMSEQVKFESIAYFGYNTQKKKYFVVGLDTGGTYPVYAEGDYDASKKTWTLYGENDEPGVGRIPIKFVIQVNDKGGITQEIFTKVAGVDGYQKIAKTVFKRK
ncbi:MAG: DUF1579 family protein [Phycisphaerales bacterium]